MLAVETRSNVPADGEPFVRGREDARRQRPSRLPQECTLASEASIRRPMRSREQLHDGDLWLAEASTPLSGSQARGSFFTFAVPLCPFTMLRPIERHVLGLMSRALAQLLIGHGPSVSSQTPKQWELQRATPSLDRPPERLLHLFHRMPQRHVQTYQHHLKSGMLDETAPPWRRARSQTSFEVETV